MRAVSAAYLLSQCWLALMLGPAVGLADDSWRIAKELRSDEPRKGLIYRAATLQGPDKLKAELHYVLFNDRRYGFKVLDRASKKRGRLVDALVSAHCVAGCNGGFFEPDFSPLGLSVADRVRAGTFSDAKLLTGVFVVQAGEPQLDWNAEFRDSERIQHLLQGGPRLIRDGEVVKGLSEKKWHRRTFLAWDKKDTWVMGFCKTVSLKSLAEILHADVMPGIKVRRALNFDGGPSSALWVAGKDGKPTVSIREYSPVRNYIGVVPITPKDSPVPKR